MKILVTGATGFLGTALCPVLEQQGHSLARLNSSRCDLTKDDSLLNFTSERYDHIFHLAAWTQAGDFCLNHPGEQWVINQQINTNVLAWWKNFQPQAKLICIGTSCAYSPDYPLKEENYLKGMPIDSLFTYAMTKRMLYVGLTALQKQFGLKYLCVVPSTLYGPGYPMDGRQMHFIFDLIRKIVEGKRKGIPVVLWGDGYQNRELIFINDFVNIMAQLSTTLDNELINIGAGSEFSIRYFAELICKKIGCDFSRIQYDSSKYVGARSKCLSIDKLKQIMPGLQLTPLENGLEKTIDWFLAKYPL